jgi:uncharacterized protein (TIGR02996 family)
VERPVTHDDVFLHHILEQPDDDGPRLIYADWLDEHGEPARAEFIRVQIELARLPRDHPRRGELEARERALLKEHEQAWVGPLLGPLPGMVAEWKFRRGFLEEVALEGRGLRGHADLLFRASPIRHLTVYLARSHLAALPPLARLTSLNLGGNSIGDEGVVTLAACPCLGRLTALNLRSNGLTDAGVRTLAFSGGLQRLAALNLSNNAVGDAGAAALAAGLPQLTSLELYWNPLGPGARRMLLARFGDRVKVSEK